MAPLDTRSSFWKAYRDCEHLCTGLDIRRLRDRLDQLGYGI